MRKRLNSLVFALALLTTVAYGLTYAIDIKARAEARNAEVQQAAAKLQEELHRSP